jgi:hypothetical protein
VTFLPGDGKELFPSLGDFKRAVDNFVLIWSVGIV